MGDSAGEPAVAPAAGAGGTAGRGPAPQLRLACLAFTVALALTLLLLAAYELAAARVPQHRAALEELIHHQTGLEVRFAALALRWGWYGPEALFQDVELSERQGVLLRAHRLIVSLDAWRMLRSGHLEARRITLEDPVIDLTGEARPTNIPTTRSALPARDARTRFLARWRGGEIDISGGTLRTGVRGGSDAATFGISRAQLRRVDNHWSAEAEVVLPQTLGTNLHLTLELRSRADLSEISSASVSLEGHHLDLAAWAAVLGVAGRSASPRSGTAELQLQAAFVQGRLQSAKGHLAAESLRWEPTPGPNTGASLERLRGNWQLRQRAGRWHLDVDELELEAGVRREGSLAADFSADGALVRAQARHVGLAPLLPLVHGYVPQPLSALAFTGEATELSFDWNSHREPGARLAVSAQFQDLSVMNAAGDTGLTGLSGTASAQESSLVLALRGHGVRLTRADAAPLEDLEIDAQVNGAASPAGTWQLQTHELHAHRAGLNLTASGAISLPATSSPLIDLRLAVKDTDAAVLSNILGPNGNMAWGAAPAALAGGHIESAEVLWRGQASVPPWSGATHFTGSLVLRGATLRQGPSWPELADLSAHIDWHGPHFHALIDRALVQGFILSEARSNWDARAGRGLDFAGRLAGDAQQLTAWLQSHPEAAAWAPGLAHLDLRGHAVLDLELALPAMARMQGDPAVPRVRIAALLDGVELHPVPGLPPLEGLRGTLGFAGGHLQRSTLAARWLDGPASLSVAERREQGQNVIVVSGRGLVDARSAMRAAGATLDDLGLEGSADWSALLTVVPGVGPAHWQLHADSSLAGVASHVSAPFDKPAGAVLPLHVDWETQSDAAQLRIALGERLAAVAALSRNGETWRIERGAVRLGGGTPAPPVEPVVLLDGHLARLDLAAALALWRAAARDAALPMLRGRLTAAELVAGDRRFPDVALGAESAAGNATLRFESAALSGNATWPARVDAEHPALLHLKRFDVRQPVEGSTLVIGIAAALSPAAQVLVDELQWQGRDLGSLSASLAVPGALLEAGDASLSGPYGEAHGTARCPDADCKLTFTFDTEDVAGTLATFGFAPEVSARASHLGGELRWPRRAPLSLATVGGSLHMRLQEGLMGPAAGKGAVPFPLLAVPALLGGLGPARAESPFPGLRFERFSADYELRGGEALTSDLHFDGDAEILVRGRVGLLSGEYEQRAWILRGEDRLPAAVRRLSPGPGVAAVWLSLRDLFGSEVAEHSRAALRLRGSWSDPIVSPE